MIGLKSFPSFHSCCWETENLVLFLKSHYILNELIRENIRMFPDIFPVNVEWFLELSLHNKHEISFSLKALIIISIIIALIAHFSHGCSALQWEKPEESGPKRNTARKWLMVRKKHWMYIPETVTMKLADVAQPAPLVTVQVTVWIPTVKSPPVTGTTVPSLS